MGRTTHASSQRRFHEFFSGRFVFFVVQKEFLRYQHYMMRYPVSLTSYPERLFKASESFWVICFQGISV